LQRTVAAVLYARQLSLLTSLPPSGQRVPPVSAHLVFSILGILLCRCHCDLVTAACSSFATTTVAKVSAQQASLFPSSGRAVCQYPTVALVAKRLRDVRVVTDNLRSAAIPRTLADRATLPDGMQGTALPTTKRKPKNSIPHPWLEVVGQPGVTRGTAPLHPSDRSCVCPDGLACHPPNTRLPRSQCFLRAVCLITWPHGLAMSSESSPTVAARGSGVVRRCRAVGFAGLAFHALHAIGSSRSIRHVLYVPCHVPYAQVRLL